MVVEDPHPLIGLGDEVLRLHGRLLAVNSDRDAAIFDFADFGAIEDLKEVAKQMLVRLGA